MTAYIKCLINNLKTTVTFGAIKCIHISVTSLQSSHSESYVGALPCAHDILINVNLPNIPIDMTEVKILIYPWKLCLNLA